MTADHEDLYPWKRWHVQQQEHGLVVISDEEKFIAFAQKYVLERAHTFEKGREQEDAWECALRARTVYDAINRLGEKFRPKPKEDEVDQRIAQIMASKTAPPIKRAPGYSLTAQSLVQRFTQVTPAMRKLADYIEEATLQGVNPHHIHAMLAKLEAMGKIANSAQCPPTPVDSKGWTG